MSDDVRYQVQDRVATITLDRPEARNALSAELVAELIVMLRQADADIGVKCVVIRGAGEHFSGGGDIKSFEEPLAQTPERRFDLFERRMAVANRLPAAILELSKPVVVATRGAVAGAGVALCLAADFVIAAESSYFLMAHVLIGLSLDAGLSGLLIPAMGIKAAKRLAMLGERLSAKEALDLGMVTKMVADEVLDDELAALLARLVAGPGTALAVTKSLLNHAAYPGFVDQLALEARGVARCAASDDFPEGVASALARRKPRFK